MGLWLKQEDGTLVEVSGGGGGSFDGEHVPTGDPTDPAMFEALDVGQLLYDGVESDGSDGGPHNHDDYLPLVGGTLTGDLQVDGNADLKINAPADAWDVASGTVFAAQGMVGGTQGSYATAMTCNGYRNKDNKWTSLGLNGQAGATTMELRPDGIFYIRTAGTMGANDPAPPIRFSVNNGLTTAYGDLHVDGAETKLTNRLTMRPSSDNGGSIDYLQKTDGSNKWVTSGPRESDDNSFVTYWYDGDWNRTLVLWKDRARFYGDLQVDGNIQASGGFEGTPGVAIADTESGLWGGNAGVAISVNGQTKLDCKTDAVIVKEDLRIDKTLRANGAVTIPNSSLRMEHTGGGDRDIDNAPNLYITPTGWVYRSVRTRGGAFAPSKLTRDSDVLERAETATLPPEIETDDDGNQTNTAEVEAHDTVELFDVVTALLLKVKELSAEIKELKGA